MSKKEKLSSASRKNGETLTEAAAAKIIDALRREIEQLREQIGEGGRSETYGTALEKLASGNVVFAGTKWVHGITVC